MVFLGNEMGTYLKHHIKALHAVRLITVQYEKWWTSYIAYWQWCYFWGGPGPLQRYLFFMRSHICEMSGIHWLVVSSHLKNISQIGSFPQVGVKIKNIWNHHPVQNTMASHFLQSPVVFIESPLGGSCNHRGLPRCQTNGLARPKGEAGGSSHEKLQSSLIIVSILSTDHGTDFLVDAS